MYYETERGLVNMGSVKQIHFTKPNEDGYCNILAFDELVSDPDSEELPNHAILGQCLETDITEFRTNIRTMIS